MEVLITNSQHWKTAFRQIVIRELLDKTMKCMLKHQVSHLPCEKSLKQYQKIRQWRNVSVSEHKVLIKLVHIAYFTPQKGHAFTDF